MESLQQVAVKDRANEVWRMTMEGRRLFGRPRCGEGVMRCSPPPEGTQDPRRKPDFPATSTDESGTWGMTDFQTKER